MYLAESDAINAQHPVTLSPSLEVAYTRSVVIKAAYAPPVPYQAVERFGTSLGVLLLDGRDGTSPEPEDFTRFSIGLDRHLKIILSATENTQSHSSPEAYAHELELQMAVNNYPTLVDAFIVVTRDTLADYFTIEPIEADLTTAS